MAADGPTAVLRMTTTQEWTRLRVDDSMASANASQGVSIWFRSIFYFNPKPELRVAAPLSFQLHALFALWPFTRLVHAFTAPLGYIFWPYVLYRTRDAHEGSRARCRGWDKIDTIPRRR